MPYEIGIFQNSYLIFVVLFVYFWDFLFDSCGFYEIRSTFGIRGRYNVNCVRTLLKIINCFTQ